MDDTVKALNDCYRHELTLLVRYLNYATQVFGLDRLHLVDLFKKNAGDCMAHAEKVGAKIASLGGTPQGKVGEDLTVPHGSEKMLEQALKDEEAAVALYGEAVAVAKKDLALRETLVHILKEEQAGVDELRLLLRK